MTYQLGWKITKEQAQTTVAETLRRAKAFFETKTRDDILWVGPVQGGRHLDLVASSAVEMGKLPFQIHALGSPTEVMENYRYDVLADMILTAKKGFTYRASSAFVWRWTPINVLVGSSFGL